MNGASAADDSNHGTLVAGVAGAEDYGVAQSARLVNVKVSRDGVISHKGVADAINDVVNQHIAWRRDPHAGTPFVWRGSVINISIDFSTGNSREISDALRYAAKEGIRE